MTRVLPVGCQDCQFLEWPVCKAPFLCWGVFGYDPKDPPWEGWGVVVEKETPGGDDDRGQGNELQPSTKQIKSS